MIINQVGSENLKNELSQQESLLLELNQILDIKFGISENTVTYMSLNDEEQTLPIE